MKPPIHIIVSFPIGVILWFFTKSIYAGILCLASGILVDSDHVIEYIIHYGWKDFSLKEIYRVCEDTKKREENHKFRKLYLVFHAVEILFLFLIAAIYTKNVYILAITLGYSTHLALDCTGNKLRPLSYSILWRATRKFNTDRLLKEDS